MLKKQNKAIKLLILISFILLTGCQNINQNIYINSYEQLDNLFKSSNEYKKYLKSNDLSMMILKTYEIKELKLTYTCRNSGEANAFESFIRNNTDYSLELVTHSLTI